MALNLNVISMANGILTLNSVMLCQTNRVSTKPLILKTCCQYYYTWGSLLSAEIQLVHGLSVLVAAWWGEWCPELPHSLCMHLKAVIVLLPVKALGVPCL